MTAQVPFSWWTARNSSASQQHRQTASSGGSVRSSRLLSRLNAPKASSTNRSADAGCRRRATRQGLNIYKIVANGALGTGPNFARTPGFNEFYYLNHYPEAAAAVQAGQYRNGLDHYNAVGAARGYKPHAPNNAIR